MNLSLFSRKNRIVNIIINDHSIRYLELKGANPPIPYRWGERMIPTGIISNGKIIDHEVLATILEECVSDWKLRNRKVRFLIPESFVIIRKVTVPAEVKDDEIKGYLYLELGSSIHLPFDEPVFDAVILSKDKDKKEVLIFAAQEENVQEYVKLFSEVKLDPVAAEVSPLAIYRLYYHLNLASEDEDMLVVQFGLNHVNICIFEKTVPFFMHHLLLEFDERQWDKRLKREGKYELVYAGNHADLSFQLDDSYKEINRLMDFYRYSLHQGKKEVSKILLNGDHPMLDHIKKDLEKRFDVPLETLNYNKHVQFERTFPEKYYLALGLALKGVE